MIEIEKLVQLKRKNSVLAKNGKISIFVNLTAKNIINQIEEHLFVNKTQIESVNIGKLLKVEKTANFSKTRLIEHFARKFSSNVFFLSNTTNFMVVNGKRCASTQKFNLFVHIFTHTQCNSLFSLYTFANILQKIVN